MCGVAQQSPHPTGGSALCGQFSAAAAQGTLLPQQLQGSSPSTQSWRPLLQHGAAEGKTQQMHGQARVKAHQPGRDCPAWTVNSAASLPIAPCTGARGGCTSPSGNSSSCCPSPDPATAVFPALRRTVLQQHGTGGSYLGSPCSARCQVAHRRTFPSGCRN